MELKVEKVMESDTFLRTGPGTKKLDVKIFISSL